MSCSDVLTELRTRDVYEVVADSKLYQVEVELLEDTPEYLHVSISVDDGSLPASILNSKAFYVERSRNYRDEESGPMRVPSGLPSISKLHHFR